MDDSSGRQDENVLAGREIRGLAAHPAGRRGASYYLLLQQDPHHLGRIPALRTGGGENVTCGLA